MKQQLIEISSSSKDKTFLCKFIALYRSSAKDQIQKEQRLLKLKVKTVL